MHDSAPSRELPTRLQAVLFHFKTRAFQLDRTFREFNRRPPRHRHGHALRDTPVAAEFRAPVWTQVSPAEFPLTAGKIHNLRLAARALDGLEVPAGGTFSFWRQLGRTTRRRGFTPGRELREGCLVPSTGGGLCQLSGLLYQAALDAGLEIVERHAHSRTLPGSAAERGLDATVFWNYVDLRFRAPYHWRLEVRLDATDLVVRIRTAVPIDTPAGMPEVDDPPRPPATGDCLTCGQTACFRHPAATAAHAPGLGHSAFLLDARWPEFDHWCAHHHREGDHWFVPLDGRRWNKPNYAWSPPAGAAVRPATVPTLLRSLGQRRLPAQGAIRQAALLAADAALAKYYADRISPECRHLVVAQNLLPHLWRLGALGGRTYDVLLTRWPLGDLHRQLDAAARAHPESATLADFRADPDLVRDEAEALARAARLITPHRTLAARFGHRAWLLDWDRGMTVPVMTPTSSGMTGLPAGASSEGPLRLFFPCSPLGRKGVHELAAALRAARVDAELLVLGRAREDTTRDPLTGIDWRPATLGELASCHALVLPAWVEHQPRIALRALSLGIRVIASEACGLPDHPLLTRIPQADSRPLAAAIASLADDATSPPSEVIDRRQTEPRPVVSA